MMGDNKPGKFMWTSRGGCMNRLERYKNERLTRRKYFFSLLFIFTLLVSGLCIADASIKSVIGEETGPVLFSVTNHQDYIKFEIMNREFYLNTEYISRDLKKLYFTVRQWYN